MSKSEGIVRSLLMKAGIEVGGANPWDIQVHDRRFYDRLLANPHLAMGEGYMDRWWDCASLDQMITRVLTARLNNMISGNWEVIFYYFVSKVTNRQSIKNAFEIGEKHYDLGNDLYCAMLDRRMNYTCAYWENATDLDSAQEAKLELICKKIGISPGMRILELGCGWGSFAKYAAEKFDAQVLGVTVSKEQVALGTELCKGLPVELRLQDYREVQGTFDAVISIGVMEHVGNKNYHSYMDVVDRCLKHDGIGFIHTIGSNTSVTSADPFTHKYIFPNGMLPSITQLSKVMEGKFVMEDWHNLGPNYDPTLMAWHRNFTKAWPALKDKYGDRFKRMWDYYLLSCAGAFRARNVQLWQIVFTRRGTPQPRCRFT
jgi:cyclopropane-fatty-acyl-phospholipid synthase